MNYIEQAKINFIKKEENLSEYASKSNDSLRLKELIDDDIRPSYFRDIDRIIHSLSYTRYIVKTQVFPFKENDHISKRMIHVQLVSKIARTIGRALNLNEDLMDINNICLMGCNIISGQGKGIVIKTGLDTFLGSMNKDKEVVKDEVHAFNITIADGAWDLAPYDVYEGLISFSSEVVDA